MDEGVGADLSIWLLRCLLMFGKSGIGFKQSTLQW